MPATTDAARARPEPLARQHHPDDARRRHAQALHRRALASPASPRTRRSSTRRIRAGDAYDEQIAELARLGIERGEDLFFELAIDRPARRGRPVPPASTSAPTASTASSRSRSRRCSPTTQRTPRWPRRRPARPGRPAEPLHQDPRHRRRACRDQRVDLRRDPGQRHAALRRRAVPGGGRGLHAGHRAADRATGSIPTSPRSPRSSVSRWDVAVADEVPDELRDRLGIAVGVRAYRAYRELLDSDRWQRLENEGARPQRLLFASTGTKDPDAPDTLYIERPRGARTPSTRCRSETLLAFADHGKLTATAARRRRRQRAAAGEFDEAGIDVDRARGASSSARAPKAFDKSWNDLLERIETHAKAVA